MHRLSVAVLVGALSFAAFGQQAPNAAPAERAWVERSNLYTDSLLNIEFEHSPERGSQQGLAKFDERISNPTLADQLARRRELEAEMVRIDAARGKESDKRVQQDLDILHQAFDLRLRREDYELQHEVPFLNASERIFAGLRGLLDDQVAPARRPAALARLRKYSGVEGGYQPFTEVLKQREREQMAKAGAIYPSKGEIETQLGRNPNYVEGIAALLRKYGLQGWEEAYARLKSQLTDYDSWVRENVLPKARSDFRLPPQKYALALEEYGVDIPPAKIAAMAHAAFSEYQTEMAPLAAQIARAHGYPSSDYRAVIAELKKQQITGEAILPFYENRLHEIENLIVANNLVTLPSRRAIIRLATPAETAQQPAPHMSPPPFLHNTGQRGEFVLPLNIPSASGGGGDQYDDFTFDAVAWTLTAHEARPGHELQFDSMVEHGVSLARALYAFNSTNVEGWGLYSEYIMQPYEPPEGQLLTLQLRLLRAARAFLDPELQSGVLTPERAYEVLEKDVVLSHAFATEEVERFTFRSPGQANSYFYGYTRLLALRKEAEAALGASFDARRFHDFILSQGLLPPELMRKAVLEEFVPAQEHSASSPERLVHRYLEVRISPDAAYVAAIEGDSPAGGYYPDVRDLVIRRVSSRSEVRIPLPCGRVSQCWPGSLGWARDGRHLAYTVRTPGSHAYSLYSVAPDGRELTKLLEFNGTLSDPKYGRDGTLAVLAVENARKEVGATEAGAEVAGDLDAAPAEQRIAIVEQRALRWASPPDLFVYEYDWRPDGSGFVGTAAPGDGDDNWWTARLYAFARSDARARLLYTPRDIRQQIATPRISPDGHTVAFIAGLMSDFGSTGGDVYTLSVSRGEAVNVTPGIKASATALEWSCGGSLRAQLLAGDQTQIVDLGSGRAAATPKVLWSGTETLRGHDTLARACPSDVLALPHESFTLPPEIEVGPAGHWRDLTRANAALAGAARVISVRWSNEGLDEQGWLLLPGQASTEVPMVTFVHGGPAAAAVPLFYGPGVQSAMLARGWAVFLPNPRGSFGQGEHFTAANVRDFGHGDLRDVLAGIDAAERVAPIDDARLGLTGGSYGGFMTMWAITQTQRFKAAVAAAGISDWQSYYGENGIDEWMLPYFGASVYDDPQIYARSSAINYIRNARTPTFAYVGERDVECPASQTVEFWHAMKALGVATAIMIYPGEGHGLREPAHAQDALQRTLEWFDRYLR
jgi:dipeptidyl aminopeptidase/acylaminoacyl peptidase